MRIVLTRDAPSVDFKRGDTIAEIDLPDGISLNFVIDAVRHRIAEEAVSGEPEPAPAEVMETPTDASTNADVIGDGEPGGSL